MHRFEITAGLAPPVSRAVPIPIGRCRVLCQRWVRRQARVSTVTLVPVGGRGVPWDLVFHGGDVLSLGGKAGSTSEEGVYIADAPTMLKLPLPYREAVVLAHIGGFSYREIALILRGGPKSDPYRTCQRDRRVRNSVRSLEEDFRHATI